MVTKKKFIVWGALLLLLIVSVSAVPGVPHNFYGSVTINGEDAPDGSLVEALIGGDSFGFGTTNNGEYGYSPDIFYVMDPATNNAGRTITFEVEGITADTYTFTNGESTRLNLAITCSDCIPGSDPDEGNGAGGGGGGGGGAGVFPLDEPIIPVPEVTLDGGDTYDFTVENDVSGGSCSSSWECSRWTACANGIKERVCIDRNSCGSNSDKPAESEACDSTDEELYDGEEKGFLTGAVIGGGTATWLGLIIIIAGIVGLFYLAKHMRKH